MDFSNPDNNIAQFGLEEGRFVADFGAGSGFYTIAAARAVGSTGKVYAVEVQKDLVQKIKQTAGEEGLMNIETLWGDIEELGGTKLRDSSVSVVIVSNVLFQVEDREGLVSEVSRILKPKGRVFIVDWDGSYGNMGPEESAVISAQDARALFEKAGFTYLKAIKAGEHHYGFSLVKS